MAHRHDELPPQRKRSSHLDSVPTKVGRNTPMGKFYEAQADKLEKALTQSEPKNPEAVWKTVEKNVEEGLKKLREQTSGADSWVDGAGYTPSRLEAPPRGGALEAFKEQMARETISCTMVPAEVRKMMEIDSKARELYEKLFRVVQENSGPDVSEVFIRAYKAGYGLETAIESSKLPPKAQYKILGGGAITAEFTEAELAQLRYAGVAGSARKITPPEVDRIITMEEFYASRAELFERELSGREFTRYETGAGKVLDKHAEETAKALTELKKEHRAIGIEDELLDVPKKPADLAAFLAEVRTELVTNTMVDLINTVDIPEVEAVCGKIGTTIRDIGSPDDYNRFRDLINQPGKTLREAVLESGLTSEGAEAVLRTISNADVARVDLIKALGNEIKLGEYKGIRKEMSAAIREGFHGAMRTNLERWYARSAHARAWMKHPFNAVKREALYGKMLKEAETATLRTLGRDSLRKLWKGTLVTAVLLLGYGVYKAGGWVFGGDGEEKKTTGRGKGKVVTKIDNVRAALTGSGANSSFSQNSAHVAIQIKHVVGKTEKDQVAFAGVLRCAPNVDSKNPNETYSKINALAVPDKATQLQEVLTILNGLMPLVSKGAVNRYVNEKLTVTAYNIFEYVSGKTVFETKKNRLAFTAALVKSVQEQKIGVDEAIDGFLARPSAKYRKFLTEAWQQKPLKGGDSLEGNRQFSIAAKGLLRLSARSLHKKSEGETPQVYFRDNELKPVLQAFVSISKISKSALDCISSTKCVDSRNMLQNFIEAGHTPKSAARAFAAIANVLVPEYWDKAAAEVQSRLKPGMSKEDMHSVVMEWTTVNAQGYMRKGAEAVVTGQTRAMFHRDANIEKVIGGMGTKMSSALIPMGEGMFDGFISKWNRSVYPRLDKTKAVALRDKYIVPMARSQAFAHLEQKRSEAGELAGGLLFDLITPINEDKIKSKTAGSIFVRQTVKDEKVTDEKVTLYPVDMVFNYFLEYAKNHNGASMEELTAVKEMLLILHNAPQALVERNKGALPYIELLMTSPDFDHLKFDQKVELFEKFVESVKPRAILTKQVPVKKKRRRKKAGTKTVSTLAYPMLQAIRAIKAAAKSLDKASGTPVADVNAVLEQYLAENQAYRR